MTMMATRPIQGAKRTAAPKTESVDATLEMARALSKAMLTPEGFRGSPGDCLIAINLADTYGLAYAEVLDGFNVMRFGSSTSLQMGAALRKRIANAAGYAFQIVEHDDEHCVVEVFLNGRSLGNHSESKKDVPEADLKKNAQWRKHPRNMMYWQTVKQACRFKCDGMLLAGADGETDIGELEVIDDPVAPVVVEAEPVGEPAPEPPGGVATPNAFKAAGVTKETVATVLDWAADRFGVQAGSITDLCKDHDDVAAETLKAIGSGELEL